MLVSYLSPVEHPRLDPGRIELLCEEIGPYAAEDYLCRALEQIAHALAELCTLHPQRARRAYAVHLKGLIDTSDRVGLTAMARIGRDLQNCAFGSDTTAHAAVLARLVRSGERSMAALWDMQGVSG